jgi:hypothetical protein
MKTEYSKGPYSLCIEDGKQWQVLIKAPDGKIIEAAHAGFAYSSQAQSFKDVMNAVGYQDGEKGAVIAVNRRHLADTVLRAAAPELLEALEEARNGLLWYQERFPDVSDGSDDEAIQRIDAAIAKATTLPEA